MNKFLKSIRNRYFVIIFAIIFGVILLTKNLNAQIINREDVGIKIVEIENKWRGNYEDYFGKRFFSFNLNASQIEKKINNLQKQTRTKTAVIWITSESEQLVLVTIIPSQRPIIIKNPEATQEKVLKITHQFQQEISNSSVNNNFIAYQKPSQKLYEWLIKPLESELEAAKIDTLILCVGAGLRTLPFAALYDGEKFLIEKYNLTRIPAFNLTPLDYKKLSQSQVLAMGASEFTTQNPLPGVELELKAITSQLWEGISILNEDFTLANLKFFLEQKRFQIVHLATHANFISGTPEQSYIQLSDTRLNLEQIGKLNWQKTPVELLVLSACNTAIGDKNAELGFAGLSIQAGVKSALASLWYVSDIGTLALMNEFYQQLKIKPTKAEALRQAQIAMLKGEVRLENGELIGSQSNIALSTELGKIENTNLSHPYYWAGFSLIGSPW